MLRRPQKTSRLLLPSGETALLATCALIAIAVLLACGEHASSPTATAPTTPAAAATPPASNPAPPTVQLSADKTSIIQSETVVLTWNTTNATGVTIQPGGPSGLGPSGTLSVSPPTTTTYTTTATGAGGTATAMMTITVTARHHQGQR